MVYGRYNYSFHGVYKVNLNQLITGGHHPVDFTQKQPGFVVRIVDQLWVPSPESWNASTSSTSPPFNCWKGFQDSPTNEIAKTKYSSELQDQCGKSYSLWCSKIPYLFPQKIQTDAPSAPSARCWRRWSKHRAPVWKIAIVPTRHHPTAPWLHRWTWKIHFENWSRLVEKKSFPKKNWQVSIWHHSQFIEN